MPTRESSKKINRPGWIHLFCLGTGIISFRFFDEVLVVFHVLYVKEIFFIGYHAYEFEHSRQGFREKGALNVLFKMPIPDRFCVLRLTQFICLYPDCIEFSSHSLPDGPKAPGRDPPSALKMGWSSSLCPLFRLWCSLSLITGGAGVSHADIGGKGRQCALGFGEGFYVLSNRVHSSFVECQR